MKLALAIACACAMTVAYAQNPPVFPRSFVAVENIRSHQNGEPLQTGTITSSWAQTPTLNATSYVESNGVGTYYLYNENKVYYTFGTQCQYYCTDPLPQMDLADSLEQYDYVHSAKFAGRTEFNGTEALKFTWNDMLGPIAMNELAIFVGVNSTTTPMAMQRKITPFGDYIGWINSTYTSFKPQVPPASAFVVPDKEYCPQGNMDQCEDSHVSRLRSVKAMLRHYNEPGVAKAIHERLRHRHAKVPEETARIGAQLTPSHLRK